ncbi:MAG TPA: hypothetical protein QGF58_18500 [Myxococcota bacterium]|nr:hypothetical protein [Myxococcota bacterium]
MLEIAPRRAELERLGFTIVRDLPDEVVGVRMRFHWDLTMRLFTVCRLRKVARLERDGLEREQDSIEAIAKKTDTSVLPRGFQFGWQLIDIWLADSASEEVLAFAGDKIGKGFGLSWHPAVVTADGATFASPIWGAAMWPKNKHVIERVGTLEGPDEAPLAGLGLALTVLVFWPALAGVVLMLCGLPLIAFPLGYLLEKDRSPPQLDG